MASSTSSLDDSQVKFIIAQLEAGKNLPLEYAPLLFPPLESNMMMGKPRVLIVDDLEDNRALLTDFLKLINCETDTAENGEECLQKLKAQSYDLVLLDIMMPKMNGYDTLKAIKDADRLKHIPVIMITAVPEIKSVVKCIKMGAEDYLIKPFDATLLLARVNATLEKKRLRDKERALLARLQVEQQRSERLLLNILPEPIAARLKENETTIADSFSDATVLFADIVNFTKLSSNVPPTQLVGTLNDIFTEFDGLVEQNNLEKIKTIGDSYMVVGGLPEPSQNHAAAVAEIALGMQQAIAKYTIGGSTPLQLRIGINSGPVVAGVIGSKKFIYDLWGDTVNIASRMEQQGIPSAIHVTQAIFSALRNTYSFTERGSLEVRGRGQMTTYLLTGRR